MTGYKTSPSIESLSTKELDDLWISVFGEPYRDTEQLSWETA